MKTHSRFIVASVLSVPLVALLILFLVGALLAAITGDCPDIVAYPVLQSVWWVSEYGGLVFLFLAGVAGAIVAAWLQSPKTKVESAFLCLYSGVVALSFGYLLWYHAGERVFDL